MRINTNFMRKLFSGKVNTDVHEPTIEEIKIAVKTNMLIKTDMPSNGEKGYADITISFSMGENDMCESVHKNLMLGNTLNLTGIKIINEMIHAYNTMGES